MKKQRKNFGSEVYHIWAQRTYPEGYNKKGGNKFFDDDSAYSFGHHFPIATFYDRGKDTIVLFTTETWGSYTGRHMNEVAHACQHYEIIRVPITRTRTVGYHNPYSRLCYGHDTKLPFGQLNGTHETNLKYLANKCIPPDIKAYRRKRKPNFYTEEHYETKRENLIRYIKFFKIASKLKGLAKKLYNGTYELDLSEHEAHYNYRVERSKELERTKEERDRKKPEIKDYLRQCKEAGLEKVVDVYDHAKQSSWRVYERGRMKARYRAMEYFIGEHSNDQVQAIRESRKERERVALEAEISKFRALLATDKEIVEAYQLIRTHEGRQKYVERERSAIAIIFEELSEERVSEAEEKIKAEVIEKWRAGEKRSFAGMYELPHLLRVNQLNTGDANEIETSSNIKVDIDDAKRLYIAVKRCKDQEREFISNGEKIPVNDYYNVDKITAEGDLRAGCHFIKWPEIERIANEMNW